MNVQVVRIVAGQLEEALTKLKTTGVRMTPQRHAILSYLLDSMTHPTADDIYRALESKFPHMSVATVYNNLKVFIEAGLVRELTYGDSSSRFDADLTDHYHALCEVCGKISDFEFEPLTDVELAAKALTGYEVKGHRLEVYGICPECAGITKH
jgi:Fur family transcriptional regulator, peroxide stress response regulator